MTEPVESMNQGLAERLKAVEAMASHAQLLAFEEILSELRAELDQKAQG
ncbi:hypothetical protein [Arthrobacter roseus]|nr:hypothetical protein [Arthrobacter roseus]MBM7848280.1 hypothetical protein [Arthrobacter roseus]